MRDLEISGVSAISKSAKLYVMAAILVMAAIGGWAISTHQIGYVVTYGVSMNPVYYAGDLVVIAKFDSYEIGDITAYHGADGRKKVLHRIIGGDAESGFVLKGDNNESIDTDTPTADEVLGRAVLHVPKVGTWLRLLVSPTSLGMLGFLFVGSRAAKIRNRRDIPRGRQKKRVIKGMSGQGGSWAAALTVAKAVRRLHPALRAVAVLSIVLTVCALAIGVLGWMKPATQTTSGSSAENEKMTFSYSAEVPRSAAYDGTTAYSPDPIYRKLVRFVVLRLEYLGKPGEVDVFARLSSESGWHSTMQLAQAKEFSSERFTGTVSLDLNGMEDRAEEASEAIGAEIGATTVAITARVKHSDGSTFEPQLSFALNAVQFSLTGGASSLVIDGSSVASSGAIYPRQISAFGRDLLTAAQARKYAVFLLLAALLCAGVVATIAFRQVPLRSREQIERRYPHLLVPVEPMPSPPGKPVVIVDKFPALVKLAEKYGQMILTWTRPDGAEDFVVRDDGVTYRYRIEPPAVPSEPESKPAPEKTTASEEPAPVAKETAPAKPPRAPRKKAAPKATTPAEEMPPKPPLKRPIRRKPEAERQAVEAIESLESLESLAELNKSVGGVPTAKPETPHEPIYDFLPHAKPAATTANPDQADGVTGK
ncbi:signal peptidase I [Actinoplanes sp. CA-015351]|uniref:signal peptidase I n=1 Tax=Actinoplanes sp. CA-015351 TaxID=3239897 RepID=UPI003D98B18A